MLGRYSIWVTGALLRYGHVPESFPGAYATARVCSVRGDEVDVNALVFQGGHGVGPERSVSPFTPSKRACPAVRAPARFGVDLLVRQLDLCHHCHVIVPAPVLTAALPLLKSRFRSSVAPRPRIPEFQRWSHDCHTILGALDKPGLNRSSRHSLHTVGNDRMPIPVDWTHPPGEGPGPWRGCFSSVEVACFDKGGAEPYDTWPAALGLNLEQVHRLMFTEWLRRAFKWVLEPMAGFFARIGLSANALTSLGCAINIAVSVVIATGRLRVGGFCLIFATLFDAVDGSVARQIGKPTRYGAFLDSVLDRVSESATLLGLAWWYMGQPGRTEEMLAYIAIVGSILVSYARARAEGLGIECKVGVFTRVERCIVIIAALILGLTSQALWLLAVGSVLTVFHRVLHVYQRVRDQPLHAPN
jgi:CDP-diacylglycerol--glycerol-3-phosphate 3-phosphatidyltransferase